MNWAVHVLIYNYKFSIQKKIRPFVRINIDVLALNLNVQLQVIYAAFNLIYAAFRCTLTDDY